jgi:hypothetical protein
MIEGKEEGFARKRKARDKANHRLIKNQHWIAPTVIGICLIGSVAGGTVALTFAPHQIGLGALMGSWVALLIFLHFALKELTR